MLNRLSLIIFLVFSGAIAHATNAIDCDDHIKSIVCLVDPPAYEGDRYKDGRACLSGSIDYAPAIISAYKAYPPFVRRAVCDLKRIYVEKEFFGPAWSALGDDSDIHSGLIGLRRAEIDAKLTLAVYLSWFEQQSFGAPSDFSVSNALPTVSVKGQNANKLKLSGTTYTFLHEMGHIFDYQRKFDDEACGQDCRPKKDSWTVISWMNIQQPTAASNFPMRSSICLNNCKGNFVSAADADKLYNGIYQHGFISQLAATNAMEDFAESFAVYVASEQMGLRFELKLASGKKYKLDAIMTSSAYRNKFEFLKRHFP